MYIRMYMCMYVMYCMYVCLYDSGSQGGMRQQSRLFPRAVQEIVEYHAWQLIKHKPR